MKHALSNSELQIAIQSVGAELCGIRSLKTGMEYMWQGDPNIWGSTAPVLFPAIGSFKNGACIINNTSYKIPKHGIIRNNPDLEVIAKTATQITFSLKATPKTLLVYPYLFTFQISFELMGRSVIVKHTIVNQGEDPMYFALGGHPAFKCPLESHEQYSDYSIAFEKTETCPRTKLSRNGLITDETENCLTETNKLQLHPHIFNEDAIILKNLISRKVSLLNGNGKAVLSLEFQDFKYLGLWAKPEAPFVCIEPWNGMADHENTNGHFIEKEGHVALEKNGTFQAKYSITIH